MAALTAVVLADTVAEIDHAAAHFRELDDRAVVLAAVDAAIDRLQMVRAELAGQLVEQMAGSRVMTSAGLLVVATKGGSATWDSSKVWPTIYRRARARADKGFEPVDAALSAVREAAGEPAWRASVLAGWGVEVGECRTVTKPRRTVKFA